MGKLGQSLVIQAASQWREQRVCEDQHLKISIIDLKAEQKVETLCVMFPNLKEVCELVPMQMDVHSAEFQRAEFLNDEGGSCDVSGVFVCMDNDPLGLYAGLTLYRKVQDHQTPVVVRMVENAGLARLLDSTDNRNSYRNLHAFPLLNQTCTPDLILRGTHEILAIGLHEAYLRGLGDMHSSSAWEDLPEEIKESNRKQADRISVILEKQGYRIAPLTDWRAADLVFGEVGGVDEVEAMARMEHDLWCQELLVDGWRKGSEKSKVQKIHPALVPWDDLPEDEKAKNKIFIRDLPKVLARAGFQIERITTQENQL